MEHPSLELLKRKRKPATVSPVLFQQRVQEVKECLSDQKIIREIAPVALVDSARLEKVVSGLAETFDLTIRDLFAEAAVLRKTMETKDSTKLTKVLEQTDTHVHNVLDLLQDVTGFLEELKANAGLERETLEKLNAYLDKTK